MRHHHNLIRIASLNLFLVAVFCPPPLTCARAHTRTHKEINVFAFSLSCVLSFPLSNKFYSNLVASINMCFSSTALIYCSYQIHIASQVRHATFHFHAVALQIRHATLTRKMTAEAEPKGSGLCLCVTFRFHSTNITRRHSNA